VTNWRTRCTQRVFAYMRERLVWDTFSHTETDTWGNTETTSSTKAWTTSGGSASDYDVTGGLGLISNGTVNVSRFVTSASGLGDVDATVSVTVPAVAATDTYSLYLLVRFVDTSNYYSLRAVFDTSGTVDLIMGRVVGGSGTALGTANDQVAYAANTTVKLRFQCYGTNLGAALKGKIWLSTEDEPDDWNLGNIIDNSPELLLGGVGFRAILTAANTNTLPLVMSLDDFTAYSAPSWLDITDAVLIAQGLGQPIQGSIGRATELAQIDETDLNFALKNLSGFFTPDNVLSPYWPDWKTGTPLRWTETIGARTFAFPDTWLEIPEVTLSFERADHPEQSDRVLHLNAVDLLTRLKRAPKFISNLGEYIKYNATPGALRAYYPLNDPSGSTYGNSAGAIRQEPLRFERVGSYSSIGFDESLVNFGNEEGPPGDDSAAVEFTPTADTSSGRLTNSALTNVAPTDSGVATLVFWVYVPEGETTLDQLVIWRDFDTSSIYILVDSFGGDDWRADIQTFTGAATTVAIGRIFPGWHLLGAQVDFSSGDIALWVDTGEHTNNTGGSGTNDLALDRIALDGGEGTASGLRMAHLQCYIGDSDAFTHDDFLAQYQVGFVSIGQHQRVDERIRQICNYAGLTDSQLDLEESDTLIQDPQFAGQRPGDLAVAAAATGGGILFTQGDRLVYHDRKHRFGL
jgi:hypothetical protein